MTIPAPRDRQGELEPQIVKKHQARLDEFNDKIQSMYPRGMATRDIQGHLEEIYGVELSPTLLCNVADAVAKRPRVRRADRCRGVYPILYLDALHVKTTGSGHVQDRAMRLAMGVQLDGDKKVLVLLGRAGGRSSGCR